MEAQITGKSIEKSTPALAASAVNLGAANPSEAMEVTVWLEVHNRGELDATAQALYDPNSASYHQWLKRDSFAARYLPSDAELKTVESFLTAHNLTVVQADSNRLFVRARGSVGTVSKAFRVQMNRYQMDGQTFRSNAGDAYVEGPAANLIRTVSGLNNFEFHHHLVTRYGGAAKGNGLKVDLNSAAVAAAAASANSAFFTTHCFGGVKTENLGTPGQFPNATYRGNTLFSSPVEPGCGYTPAEVRTAYNLNGLYAKGFDGTGQSIVIIDWCGSPSIMQDANTFSARFGLPPLTSSNFQIINYPSASTCASEDAEINLDVEWAHAVAPGANIVLLVPPSATFQDIDQAQYYAETAGLGNVISGSYGAEESQISAAEVQNQNLLNEIAAVFGVAANFSSGDDANYSNAYPVFRPASVSMPAASPYATAVGGVSLALKPDNTIAWQTGWGTNETELSVAGAVNPVPSPINYTQQFVFGSGGGTSAVFAKPSYQDKLSGTNRMLPDIAWLADPFTGPVIAITIPGVYPTAYEAIGGTSAACPMFAALWAIADQEAGASLGQAAPHLYGMPAGTITDVLPKGSTTNVSGTIRTSSSTATKYTADQLAQPLRGVSTYYDALFNNPTLADTTLVVTFGTDDGLLTMPGWDFVTGLGTPNATAFADYFNPAASQ